MPRSSSRLSAALVALALLAVPVAAHSRSDADVAAGAGRPLTVEDILALESFGRGGLSPDGRWAVFERRGPYATIPRFDYAQRSPWAILTLWRVDLRQPDAPPVRLLADEPLGLLRGPWSPDGERLLVYRFGEGRFEVGWLSMETGRATWSGLTPEIPLSGAAAEWRSDHEILLTVRPDGSLPAILRYYAGSQARTAEAWARTSQGRAPARTVIDTDGGVARAEILTPRQALVALDVRTGARRLLAEGEEITDFALAPDGQTIAVVEGGEPLPMEPGPILQAEADRRQRLVFIEARSGRRVSPAPGLDLAPHLLRWAPDSRRILVWARTDGQAWTDGALMAVGPDGAQPIPRGVLSPGSGAEILRGVRADWVEGHPVLFARPGPEDRADWWRLGGPDGPENLTGGLSAPPATLAAEHDGRPWLFADGAVWTLTAAGARRLSPEGLTLRPAAIADAEQPFRLRMNEAPRHAWVSALSPDGRSWIVQADGTTRALGPAGEPHGSDPSGRLLAASPTAALVQTQTGLVDHLVLRTADSERRLASANGDRADVVPTVPLPVPHLDREGRSVVSRLFLPAGGAAAARGLVVAVYPGSVDTGVRPSPLILAYGVRAEVLAGAGYAVLSPVMPMKADGSGELDGFTRDVDLALDAVLAAHPDLPRNRLALFGHSYGGFAALGIAARTRRFRAVIASSAITDLAGHWGEFIPATRSLAEDGLTLRDQQGWVEAGQGGRGGPPWTDPQAYGRESPYLSAYRITAPVLLLSADRDYVPLSQSERIFSVLHRQGVRARLVTYWGEHHHRWSPANIRDQYGQIFTWLDDALSAVPITPPAAGDAPRSEPSSRSPPSP